MADITRRDFLAASLLSPALLGQLAGGDARFVSTVPLGNPGDRATPPFGRLLGAGLDARLFTDLSLISPDTPETLVTPADRFFVRTARPPALPAADSWTIRLGGLVRSPVDLPLRSLEPLVAPAGRMLLECSGNVDQSSYGLMSAGDWDGVPLRGLLERATPTPSAYRILVAGVDDTATTARTSVAGASWIFEPADLDRAILATRLNGAPLPPDHGFPVRLIVPGWYGCVCSKWVNQIDIVADEALATVQMREFAARTHQAFESSEIASGLRGGRPIRARDFAPAVIDTAAMPVRVEKWTDGGRPFYRVVGIIWGGTKPTNALSIRFKSGDAWTRVEACPMPASTLTWSLWSHTWRPTERGKYQIVLRVDDPTIRTRRLDLFFYVREVDINEI